MQAPKLQLTKKYEDVLMEYVIMGMIVVSSIFIARPIARVVEDIWF